MMSFTNLKGLGRHLELLFGRAGLAGLGGPGRVYISPILS